MQNRKNITTLALRTARFCHPLDLLTGTTFWMVSGGRRGPWAPFERFESSVVDFMTFCWNCIKWQSVCHLPFFLSSIKPQMNIVDKPARLTIRVLLFLFLIVRRVPRPSESGCKKCNGLKKYLLGHTFSWKRLSAILCPWNPPWWWFFSLKLNKKCLKTPSKIKGLSFISSNLGNMDFFLIFNCISH